MPLSAAQYLKKSKSQKTAAFILLGAGAVAFIVVSPGNLSFEASGNLIVAGGLAALGSIPLFIASGKNKRKSRNATVFLFKIESAPVLVQRSFIQ
jgi:uncharacterized membrane protein YebE (DUF533 family)